MRGTKLVSGLAMLAVVGAVLSYPAGAKASPQLTMATGVGVAPQINNGFMPGAKRAINGAKNDKAQADAKVKELNGLMDDKEKAKQPDLGALPSKVYSAAELILAVQKNPKGAEGMYGTPVRAEGVVLEVQIKDGRTLVHLGAPNPTPKSAVFFFRLPGEVNLEKGKLVTLEGRFISRAKMDGIPNDVYLVNGIGLDAETAPAAAQSPQEPDVPFDGWKFVGSVEAEGGATGVFVKENKVLYAQPGDHLSDDVQVVRMKAGEVVLKDGKTVSVVSPW